MSQVVPNGVKNNVEFGLNNGLLVSVIRVEPGQADASDAKQ